jgi:GH24 family phage-related lysozyme (muramidase)
VATDIERLSVLVEANTKQYANAMNKLQRQTNTAINASTASIKRLDTSIGTMSASATKSLSRLAGMFGIGLGVEAFTSAIRDAVKSTADMRDVAARIGITTDALQEMRYAAGQSGVEIGQMDDALSKFSKNIGQAANGSGDLLKILQANNVSLRDSKGNLRPLNDLLGDFADLVKRAANDSDRLVLVTTAFAKGGIGMVNVVRDGKAGLAAFADEAHRTGQILNSELADKAGVIDDKFTQLTGTLSTTFKNVLLDMIAGSGDFADQLERVATWITNVGNAITSSKSSYDDIIRWFGMADDLFSKLATQNIHVAALDELNKQLQSVRANIQKLNQEAAAGDPLALGELPGLKAREADLMNQITVEQGRVPPVISQLTKAELERTDQLAAIKDAAQSFNDAAGSVENATTKLGDAAAAMKSRNDALSDAAKLIISREGFKSSAYYDVNAYRVGFGSDTTTAPNGTSSAVTAASTTTVADAMRDLMRRIAEIQMKILQQIGDEAFKSLSSGSLAALTSVFYNYGHLPSDIAKAAQSGNATSIAAAIGSHTGDNAGINKRRRIEEQQVALTGVPGGEAAIDVLKAQTAAMDEQNQKTLDLAKAKQDLLVSAEREIEALGLEAKSFGETTYEAERQKELQNLLNQATAAGIPITNAYRENLAKLAADHAAAAVALEDAKKKADSFNQSQQQLIESADEFRDFSKDLLGGFIQDLESGKSATEALGDALKKVADKLLDMALDNILGSLFGQQGTPLTGIGGFLGSLFGFGGVTAHAAGGDFDGSGPILVGEKGPELIMPKAPGSVVPNGQFGRATQSQQHVSVSVGVEPSPLFVTRVKQEVSDGNRRMAATMPSILANRQARGI